LRKTAFRRLEGAVCPGTRNSFGLYRVHYTDWGSEWDEWVERDRLRPAAERQPLERVHVGQRLEARWHGTWWAAEIVAAKNGFYKVHYTGWGPEWDEWMEIDRLR
jgi:hypothetical protein